MEWCYHLLLLYRLATTIEVFMRFQLYYMIFFVAGISYLTIFLQKEQKKYMFHIY